VSRRRRRWSLAGLALAAAIVPASIGGSVAADGLELASDTTYTLDPAATVVRVESTLTLTNTVPDRVEGNVVRQTYYSGFSLPAPVGIADVRAVSAGAPLRTTVRLDPSGEFTVIEVELARNLFSGERTTVTVSYDITGSPPRSTDPTRVNPAYAAFLAWGVGSPGQVAVRVVVPEGFEVETLGAETERAEGLGVEVFTATEIAEPEEFVLFVSARNDAALDARRLTVGDAEFEVRSWPGDDEWAEFTARQVAEGVPLLAELIGQPWPVEETVQVRQAYTPYLYGYAGWFDTAAREIEVGEALDAEVVLHELSHAWFNRSLFAERWLNEGFAQVSAAQAVARLGGPAREPGALVADQPGAFPLNDWQNPVLEARSDEVAAREEYGYQASWWVVDAIADEVGWDALAAVIDAAARRTVAYVGDAAPEVDGTVVDWRRFLDLVAELTGSARAEQVLRERVVTPAQAAELDARAEARRAYEALQAAGRGWAPPLGVRRAMGTWTFTEAGALIDDAQRALATRDALLAVTRTLGLTPVAALEERFESAEGDLDAVRREVDEQLASAERIAAATAAEVADRSLLEQVGLWGDDPTGTLAAAREAFEDGDTALATRLADDVIGTVESAGERGRERVAIASGALLAALTATGVLVARRRRATPPPAPDELNPLP
jgi:hypothetical protein